VKKALTIFIGFVHDFAAGCWAATVLAVFWIERVVLSSPGLADPLMILQKQFFWAGVGCTVIVLLAGMGRTFTYAYIGSVYGEQSEQLRRRMLVVKNVLLLTIFGLGTWWQYALAFSRH
jgi:hypothetical protein